MNTFIDLCREVDCMLREKRTEAEEIVDQSSISSMIDAKPVEPNRVERLERGRVQIFGNDVNKSKFYSGRN